tara:strand:- start:1247 stop:1441 length:195 start_codon:yes stop_codon:yes gene_type:complete
MNMPYISLETAFKVIDKVASEYDALSKEGNHSEEKAWGRAGLTASVQIKRELIKEIQRRERLFD